ncbi:uncharacterized protein LOC113213743 [Frankliniella occidentalis]|uniref:Uncharacterized protein LOC113213743 n=1 Tax=Frankliniella occidentalis TaxID=133901 RepID=A0A6J1T520_FRAOC|nr:uncharacterized protein LOC113213743 [Frankliniella occidentalis]
MDHSILQPALLFNSAPLGVSRGAPRHAPPRRRCIGPWPEGAERLTYRTLHRGGCCCGVAFSFPYHSNNVKVTRGRWWEPSTQPITAKIAAWYAKFAAPSSGTRRRSLPKNSSRLL